MNRYSTIISIVLAVILVGGAIGGGFFYWQLYQKNQGLLAKNTELQNLVKVANDSLTSATARLQAETDKTNYLAEKVNVIASSVGTLEKLSQTDKELLQKYSKVYFLNEHYVPDSLATVTPEFLSNHEAQKVHAKVWPFLEKLLQDASSTGTIIKINSGYRSFGTQAKIKASYKLTYGASSANKFSADQGYSEHQLGTTVDFDTPSIKGDFSKFGKTTTFAWLDNNAHKYGFIMSYPDNNSYYQYEPWHWRFVGVQLATRLHDEDKHFYSYPQKIIDLYLISIFD
ncbi:MAG: D-alanyl-D-alanine carboxypeptidase family protein [Candidatus Paceibacterota bacterium]|jgi:D-alanyl-D-alanine carboxypeptidase